MAPAESAREVSVLPRMIEVIVRIVTARIVPDPLAVRMNVWSVWMPAFIHIGMIFFDGVPGALHGSGTVSRRLPAADLTAATLMTTAAWLTLRKNRKTTHQQRCEKSRKVLHVHLRN